jgi:hypothetical protein
MDQSKYVTEIAVNKHSKTDCIPSSLPSQTGFMSCLAHMDLLFFSGMAKNVYPSLLGSFLYAVVCTRPDVSTTLSILGFAQAHPTEAHHLHALEKAVHYLRILSTCAWHWGGGVRTTTSNLLDSRMQIGQMIVDNGSHDPGIFTLGRGRVGYKSKQRTYVAQFT